MAVFVWIKLSPGPRFRFALNDSLSDGREWAAVRMGDAIRTQQCPSPSGRQHHVQGSAEVRGHGQRARINGHLNKTQGRVTSCPA